MSAHGERLDQFEEGNATGGHASELESIRRQVASPSSYRMTARRFPAPWRAEPIPGGYVVRDANGQACPIFLHHLMQVFGTKLVARRDNDAEARQAKVLTKDEARRIAIKHRAAAGAIGEGRARLRKARASSLSWAKIE
jgi:hypothetical protein